MKSFRVHYLIVALLLWYAGPASSASAKGSDPIVGHWIWQEGATVDLSANGQAVLRTAAFGMEGAWAFASTDDGERKYVIKWQGGLWIDKLTLSADNRHLFGQNQIGVKINATRAAGSRAPDSPDKQPATEAPAKETSGDQSPVHSLPRGVKVTGVEVVNKPPDKMYGDIQVRLSDGRKELWTNQSFCCVPHVSGKGDAGWVYGAKSNEFGRRVGKDILVLQLANGKRKELAPNSNGPFVEDWAFVDQDSAVVIKSRQNHGAASFIKYDLARGGVLGHVDGYLPDEQAPAWVRPFAD